MKKVLAVGQTPPPWGGQSIMIEKILQMKFDTVKLYHVRMSFSSEFNEVGKFKLKKCFHIFYIIAAIYKYRFRHNIKVLYYPPAGPNLIPILRDILILISVRFLFKKTIFHFHAGGVSEFRIKIPHPFRVLFDMAYNNADVAIRLSTLNPEDGKNLKAKKEVVIPCGIEDFYQKFIHSENKARQENEITLLFVGVVMHSKGVEDLIRAAALLKDTKIRLRIVGKAESVTYLQMLKQLTIDLNIHDIVEFCGVKTGDDKFLEYFNADLFCFPSFFESETFGIVLLEAMCFNLPVIATYWRGIPSIVCADETGLLVPINDIEKLAVGIRQLIIDEETRVSMGTKGRKRFLDNYSIDTFNKNMNSLFSSI